MRDMVKQLEVQLPTARPRRLRRTPALRALVRETHLHSGQLVAPLFITSGEGRREPILSMPGQDRISVDVRSEERRVGKEC